MKNGIDRHADVGVGRAGGGERRHGAGFGDAFFENLAVLRFLVVHQDVAIDGLIELAAARVDAALAEHRFHAEGARFIGNDRHDVLADLGQLQQRLQHRDEARWWWKLRGRANRRAIR